MPAPNRLEDAPVGLEYLPHHACSFSIHKMIAALRVNNVSFAKTLWEF